MWMKQQHPHCWTRRRFNWRGSMKSRDELEHNFGRRVCCVVFFFLRSWWIKTNANESIQVLVSWRKSPTNVSDGMSSTDDRIGKIERTSQSIPSRDRWHILAEPMNNCEISARSPLAVMQTLTKEVDWPSQPMQRRRCFCADTMWRRTIFCCEKLCNFDDLELLQRTIAAPRKIGRFIKNISWIVRWLCYS